MLNFTLQMTIHARRLLILTHMACYQRGPPPFRGFVTFDFLAFISHQPTFGVISLLTHHVMMSSSGYDVSKPIIAATNINYYTTSPSPRCMHNMLLLNSHHPTTIPREIMYPHHVPLLFQSSKMFTLFMVLYVGEYITCEKLLGNPFQIPTTNNLVIASIPNA